MVRSLLLAFVVILALLGITGIRSWTRSKVRPSGPKDLGITFLGLIGTTLWFTYRPLMERLGLPDTLPDSVYTRYTALVFGALTAMIAAGKHRNLIAWFAGGLWFLFIAFLAVIFLPKLHDALCPTCRKGVDAKASVCPHCRTRLAEMRA